MKRKTLLKGYGKKMLSMFLLLGFSLLFTQVYAQDGFKVSGTVTDPDENVSLLGATVLEKGTANGTVTDFDRFLNDFI